jgi:hypothetical protein
MTSEMGSLDSYLAFGDLFSRNVRPATLSYESRHHQRCNDAVTSVYMARSITGPPRGRQDDDSLTGPIVVIPTKVGISRTFVGMTERQI